MKVATGVLLALVSACGFGGKETSFDDPLVCALVSTATKSDRTRFGFSPIERHGKVLLEVKPRGRGDAEIIITTPTSRRMVAFLKTTVGYEWLAEMESQYGPKTYESPDGEYREEIVIAYQRDRAVYVGGIPNNQTWLSYRGDDSRLILPYSRMTLGDFAPILSEWKAKAPLQ